MSNEVMRDGEIVKVPVRAAKAAAGGLDEKKTNNDPREDEAREKAISDALAEAAAEMEAADDEELDEDEEELELDIDEDTEQEEVPEIETPAEEAPTDEREGFYDDLIASDWEMVLAEQELENKKKAEKAKAKKAKERREREKRQREQNDNAARQSAAYTETSYQPAAAPEEYHEEHHDHREEYGHTDHPVYDTPQSVQHGDTGSDYHTGREEPHREEHHENYYDHQSSYSNPPANYSRGGESTGYRPGGYEHQEPSIYEKAASEQSEQRRQEIDRTREAERRQREEERRREIERKSQEIKEREQSHLGMVSKSGHLDLRENANNLEKVEFSHGNGGAENPTQTATAMPAAHYEEFREPRVAPQYTYGLGGTVAEMVGVESYRTVSQRTETQLSPRETLAVKEGTAYTDYG